MRNTSKYLLLLFCLLPFISCQRKGEQKAISTHIPIDLEANDEVSVFDIFSDIDIIPMEENDSSLFSPPRKMFVKNDTVYLWDRQQHEVLLFNMEGRFLSKLSRKGEGPEEYIAIDVFNLNRFTGNIEVLCGDKIQVYDRTGNKFLHTIKLPTYFIHSFTNITPDVYALFFMSREGKSLSFFSEKENGIIGEALELPKAVPATAFQYLDPFFIYKDTVRIVTGHDGNTYTLTDTPPFIRLYRSWDVGEYKFDVNTLEAGRDWKYYLDFFMKNSTRQAFGFNVNDENDQYCITAFRFRNENQFFLYNKHTGKQFLFPLYKEGFKFTYQAMDNEYVYVMAPYEYMNLGIDPNILSETNKKKLEKLNEDSNPFLIRFKFRK